MGTDNNPGAASWDALMAGARSAAPTQPSATISAGEASWEALMSPPKEAPTPGLINGTVRALANGASLGFADKLDAATEAGVQWAKDKATGNPPSFGELYGQALAGQRQMDASFHDKHPALSITSEIAGGIGGMVAAPQVAGVNRLLQAGKVIPAYYRPAAIGAGIGSLSGVGHDDGDLASKAEAAGVGAAGGAVVGAVLPPVLRGVGSVISTMAAPITNRLFSGPATSAERKVVEAIGRDGLSLEDVGNKLTGLGPNATMADAGGANLRGLGETVANMPGTAAAKAAETLETRAAGQGQRVANSVSDNLAPVDQQYPTLEKLLIQRRADAAPLYDAAYGNLPPNPEVMASEGLVGKLMPRPSMKAGMANALKIAAEEGRDPNTLGIVFNEAGDPVFTKVPSWQTLDYIKRGLDDVVEKYRDPTTGKLVLDTFGRAADATRTTFRSLLKEMNPDYAKALDAYSGPSQAMEALAQGRSFIANDSEVSKQIISDLSPADREMFLIGAARAIRDKIYSVQDGADVTRRIFGNPLIREKLEAIFPGKEAYQAFRQEMENEALFAQTRNAVLKGSQTARRLAGQEDMGIDPSPLVDAVTGNLRGAAFGAGRQMWNMLTRPPAAQAESIGNMLFQTDPAANAQTLLRLGQRAQQGQMTAERNRLLRVMMSGEAANQIGDQSSPPPRR